MNKGFHIGSFFLFLFPATAAVLQQQTVTAWDGYVQGVESRMRTQIDGGHFLWMDESPERMQRVRQGEVVVAPMEGHHPKGVPGGLIHDWIGAAFIPDTTLHDVLTVVRNYDRYQDYYSPTVIQSRTISQAESGDRFDMVWLNKALFLATALEGEYKSSYVRLGEKRCYDVAQSTRVQQIEHFREAGERRLPPDEGSGYIWRLYSISKFEERDGGVYVELEVIALSRPVPVAMHWVVDPIVARLSRNSLTLSLRQSRDAVRSAGEVARVNGRQRASAAFTPVNAQ